MAEFEFEHDGQVFTGVCETDATDEVIQAAVVADSQAPGRVPGTEYRVAGLARYAFEPAGSGDVDVPDIPKRKARGRAS